LLYLLIVKEIRKSQRQQIGKSFREASSRRRGLVFSAGLLAPNQDKEIFFMTDFMEIIKGRRSVRKYEDKAVPEAMLNQILDSVKWAPSWANTQCWEVIVIKDPALKEKVQGIIGPKNPATKAIVAAPVLLALCGKRDTSGYYNNQATTKFGDWLMFDLGLATQNICLTAHQLGLGTVIVGLFDHNKAMEILNVPEGYELVTLIPLGYPAKISSPPKRKEISEFVHYEKF
jgi:nitroreductase